MAPSCANQMPNSAAVLSTRSRKGELPSTRSMRPWKSSWLTGSARNCGVIVPAGTRAPLLRAAAALKDVTAADMPAPLPMLPPLPAPSKLPGLVAAAWETAASAPSCNRSW